MSPFTPITLDEIFAETSARIEALNTLPEAVALIAEIKAITPSSPEHRECLDALIDLALGTALALEYEEHEMEAHA